MIGFLHKD